MRCCVFGSKSVIYKRMNMNNPLGWLPPEKAHALAQWYINLRYSAFFAETHAQQNKPYSLWNLTFPNRLGLAAGWDKNADCFDALFRLGFGFVEVGTVTPKPQAGNPKPRLFRLREKKALINRMGFNNDGIDAMVENLKVRRAVGVLGVNIGKNKETSLENAAEDYVMCLKAVYPYADYIVVNISSPNTPHLRELQSAHYLQNLLKTLIHAKKASAAISDRDVPLLVKTTVDLPESHYDGFVSALIEAGIDGLIISNTTVERIGVEDCCDSEEVGGLSGPPLLKRSINMIRRCVEISHNTLPIIGVGGIANGQDALAYQAAGASLFQTFTGFVYRGPSLMRDVLSSLAQNER